MYIRNFVRRYTRCARFRNNWTGRPNLPVSSSPFQPNLNPRSGCKRKSWWDAQIANRILSAFQSKVFCIETLMILRAALPSEYEANPAAESWAEFVESQNASTSVLGYISQPAHAALSGRLAAALNGRLFGQVPEEVIAAIGNHDAGWAQSDLAALEDAERSLPLSFVSTPTAISVSAWRRSIAEAQSSSPLSTFLIRSHFCLLARRDGDVEHQRFRDQETERLQQTALEVAHSDADQKRFVDLLGFCDLLSLHLCSGWPVEVQLPLAHPADPSPKDSEQITISIERDTLHLDKAAVPLGTRIFVGGWARTESGALHSRRYEWTIR
jgi:hypothetical protein